MRTTTRFGPTAFKRHLNINQAPLVSSPVSVAYNSLSKADALLNVENLPNLKTMEHLEFEAVGEPPSAMSVGIPPSVPVYVRRKTLLTIQGNPLHMSISKYLLNPVKGFFYGNFTSRYEKLIATEPFTVMVSADAPSLLPRLFSRTTQKSFASISLDGETDWALLKRDALHIYGGPSLYVGKYALPGKISRQLAQRLGMATRETTGLFNWFRSGYNFVNGRGIIGLVGNGVLYTATVAEGEELAVNKNNLVGLTVNGPHDLQNCVVRFSHPFKDADKAERLIVPPPQVDQIRTWRDVVTNAKFYYWRTYMFFLSLKKLTPNVLVGNQDFVRVIGPRTILIQSGAPYESFERNFRLPSLKPEVTLREVPLPKHENKPQDYLNIVTIDPQKGAIIESTKDFKNSINANKER